MELSFVSRNSQSEIWKEKKLYSDEQFAKQIQSLMEAKSGLHPVKGQATFPALVPDLSFFYANESKLHSSDWIGPNSMVLVRQSCVFWLAYIEAKEE